MWESYYPKCRVDLLRIHNMTESATWEITYTIDNMEYTKHVNAWDMDQLFPLIEDWDKVAKETGHAPAGFHSMLEAAC